jgi:hypothetical protein
MADKIAQPDDELSDWLLGNDNGQKPILSLWTAYTDYNPDTPMTRRMFDAAVQEHRATRKPVRGAGRPSIFSQETIDYICQELAKGSFLTEICRGDAVLATRADPLNDLHTRPDVMPAPRTVHEWEEKDDKISAALARAREIGEAALIQEGRAIADNASEDWTTDADGNKVLNREHVQRSKLRIETRLKLAAVMNPRRWGNYQRVDHDVIGTLADDLNAARDRAKAAGSADEPQG